MHWDWNWDWCWDGNGDWDLHHDYNWHLTTRIWPWKRGYLPKYTRSCHRSCYSRWGCDLDVCSRYWHTHAGTTSAPPWCHRSCLVAQVIIETGEEPDTSGKGTFKVVIDVHHFRADELLVKVKNHDTIVLEGKQQDGRAAKNAFCVTREFSRKFKLPRNYDATQTTASLSTDGMLTIAVPAPPALDDVERLVDIVQTGAYFGSNDKDNDEDNGKDNGSNSNTKAIANGAAEENTQRREDKEAVAVAADKEV